MYDVVVVEGKLYQVKDGEFVQMNLETGAAQVKFADLATGDDEDDVKIDNVEAFAAYVLTLLAGQQKGMEKILEKAEEAMAAIKTSMEEVQTACEKIDSKIAAQESAITSLQEGLSEAQTAITSLAGLQATLTEIQTGVSGLTGEIASLKERVVALEAETEPEKPEGPPDPEEEGGDNGDEGDGGDDNLEGAE